MYLILMMGANFGAGRIASDADVGCWHEADVQPLVALGPLTGALPTLGPECRFITAFQTWRRGVLNDRV